MTTLKAASLAACVLAWAGAQTFPPEYRTDDATVTSKIRYFVGRMSEEHGSLSSEYVSLITLDANRVYRQLDAQARVVALQTALPLVKAMAMSETLRKEHDEYIASRYGAVDHGLKLPYRPDPRKRFNEMSQQIQKNPAAARNPQFMEEFRKVQQQMASALLDERFDWKLRLFTKPLADVKREFEDERRAFSSDEKARKCYDEAAPLADSAPDRFRLLAFRCAMLGRSIDKSEAEADRIRKERAQRLYDERSVKGAIRKALTQFLETASTVDFDAQTTARGDRQVFVNPEYEHKDRLWKLIYRNGKEPTAVVVNFARAWLAELQPPAPAPEPAKVKAAGSAKAAPAKASTKK